MRVRRYVLIVLLLGFAGCELRGHVTFQSGQCFVDGHALTLGEVEARQASLSERILARQPLFVVVTVFIVIMAGASNAEKLFMIFSARKESKGLGERLRLMFERYRRHPVRYFSLVIGTLGLLVLAGGFYVYLDADKRASERDLGMLQFCHLALRSVDEQSTLTAERKNLISIQSTAGSIRALVDRLPPDEQRKAHEIVARMNDALDRQGKLMSDYMLRNDAATKERADTLARGLSGVEADVLALKSLPAGMHDLGDQLKKVGGKVDGVGGALSGVGGKIASVDGKLTGVDGKLTALDGKLTASSARLDALDQSLKALAARPQRACQCICASGHRLDGGVLPLAPSSKPVGPGYSKGPQPIAKGARP